MKRFITSLLLLFTLFANSQQKTLSEKEFLRLEQEAKFFMNVNVDSSFVRAEQIALSNNPIHQASSAGIKSYLYQINGNESKSDRYYQTAMRILNSLPDSPERSRTMMVILNYGGLIKWKREDLGEAYVEFEKCRELAIQLGDNYQLTKVLNNLSDLDIKGHNYNTALATLQTSNSILQKMKVDDLTQKQYWDRMSKLHYKFGNCFEQYGVTKSNFALLDSAIYHYEISIRYTEDLTLEKLSSQINTAIIRMYKGQYQQAEKSFFHLLKVCEEYKVLDYQGNIFYHLGLLYVRQENYSEAEVFFNKLEKFHKKHDVCYAEFVQSNYYMAVIQEQYGNFDKAEKYLRKFEKEQTVIQNNHRDEVEQFNYTVLAKDLEVDIESLDERIKSQRRLFYVYVGSGILLLVILIFFLRKSIKDKRKIKLKLAEFKEKFKQEDEQKKKVFADTIQSFTMNDSKEKEILAALEKLVEKEYYLNSDFGLQNVSKKIKTNTTYLSHVVNKNYGKSFSEYSNELKMNYVIRQMMDNKTFRMYSTQAIAESVGYKSAVSFTRSFKKRTGVTPVQFLKSIES